MGVATVGSRAHGAESANTPVDIRGAMEKCCEENIQCSEGETGEIYCQECLTYQCSACERFLHATKEFRVHTRQNIILLMAEPDKLPQETRKLCKHWCSSKNPVSVSCQDCEMDFCEECDSSMHQGRRKSHLRSKYTEEEVPEGKEKTFSSYLLVDSKEDLLVSVYFVTNGDIN